MTTYTPGIDLPKLIAGGGSVALANQALVTIDNFLSRGALSIETAPPGGATDDDMYLVASASATGDFASHENEIALRVNGAWYFITPATGTRLYIQANKCELVWGGTTWSIWRFTCFGEKTNGNVNSSGSTRVAVSFNNWIIADDDIIERVGSSTTDQLQPKYDGWAHCWFAGEISCSSAGTITVGIGFNSTTISVPSKRDIVMATGDVLPFYVERIEECSGGNDEFYFGIKGDGVGTFALVDDKATCGVRMLGST